MRKDTDALVEIIRFSNDPEERKRALAELKEMRLVAIMENAPAAAADSGDPKKPLELRMNEELDSHLSVTGKPKEAKERSTWAKVARVLLIIVAVITGLCLLSLCVILASLGLW